MQAPYNAAQKAISQRVPSHEVNYFQPKQIVAILDALEQKPIKWRAITHLLIIIGYRRDKVKYAKNKHAYPRQGIVLIYALKP